MEGHPWTNEGGLQNTVPNPIDTPKRSFKDGVHIKHISIYIYIYTIYSIQLGVTGAIYSIYSDTTHSLSVPCLSFQAASRELLAWAILRNTRSSMENEGSYHSWVR